RSENPKSRIFSPSPARCGLTSQDVVLPSAALNTICCTTPLPGDRLLTTENGCFAYFFAAP
ncbi:TPA: hypothetical protein ACH7AF_005099, partial [Escherichia coli]